MGGGGGGVYYQGGDCMKECNIASIMSLKRCAETCDLPGLVEACAVPKV